MSKLTPKQQRFAEEYLLDLNATQAAIRAGYSGATAYSAGQRLLNKVEVRNAIRDAMEARSERTEITQDMVLMELASIAFNDMADVATWGPDGLKLKQTADLAPEVRKSVSEVSEIKTVHGVTVRVKLHDKLAALTLSGKHLGMFGAQGTDRAPRRRSPAQSLAAGGHHPGAGPLEGLGCGGRVFRGPELGAGGTTGAGVGGLATKAG